MGGNVSRLGNIFEDVAIKAPVRVATTAAILLTGLQTIDGVALAAGDRVLVKNQATPAANGIYQASTGNWIRTQDASKNTDFVPNTCVVVSVGTINGSRLFTLTCPDSPVVIGTSLLTWGSLLGAAASLPTGYWSGFAHSNDVSTPNTKIDIGAGFARDSTDAVNIAVTAGVIDCNTVGVNGLDQGALAAFPWYYTFVIAQVGGSAAFIASASPTAPLLPAGYSYFRRIGSFLTDGAARIIPFTHVNDNWSWMTSVRETGAYIPVSTTPGLFTTTVPRVRGTIAIFNILYFNSVTAVSGIALRAGYAPAVSVAQDGYSAIQSVVNIGAGGQFQIPVDGAGHISAVCDQAANSFLNIYTNGWIDRL